MLLLFKYRILLSACLLTTLVSFSGCVREPDSAYVDFSDRSAVGQPEDRSPENAYFKVAVGSIISAQETVIYYHKLLEYIADGSDVNPEKIEPELRIAHSGTLENDLFHFLSLYWSVPVWEEMKARGRMFWAKFHT